MRGERWFPCAQIPWMRHHREAPSDSQAPECLQVRLGKALDAWVGSGSSQRRRHPGPLEAWGLLSGSRAPDSGLASWWHRRESTHRGPTCVFWSLRCLQWLSTVALTFSPRSLAIKEFFSKPKYNHILKPEDCLSEPCTILQLDMRTVQISDLEVRKRWIAPYIR